MKRILFTWELGAGLGHVLPISQYCALLPQFDLYVALRDLKHAGPIFKNSRAKILPAPFLQRVVDNPIKETLCYAELLHNAGFGDEKILGGVLHAWRNLFDLIKPDAVVFDHSPAALLASAPYPFKKILSGSGFICPPAETPLGVFFPESLGYQPNRLQIEQAERQTLASVNKTLQALGQTTLEKLGDIYAIAEQTLLTTVAEFDHFPNRRDARYLGINRMPGGKTPTWPNVGGKRIFAYLKPFKNLPVLLESLKRSGQAVIIYSNNIDRAALTPFQSANLCFEFEPLNLRQIAADCDFAIVNGNHDTSSQLALSGVPLLVLPLQREQQIYARLINQHGAGIGVDPDKDDAIIDALNKLAAADQYRLAARNVANRYPDFDTGNNQQLLVAAIAESLTQS